MSLCHCTFTVLLIAESTRQLKPGTLLGMAQARAQHALVDVLVMGH